MEFPIANATQNWIKNQAHDHPKFRTIAARYGQTMHQVSMRMSVVMLRDAAAEKRAKEKAEAPTVKTKEQTIHEEALKKEKHSREKLVPRASASTSIWKRVFKALPEEKAVDLFADVIGDSFILFIAGGLILYEYLRTRGKPDVNAEKIAELRQQLEELEVRERELEESERLQRDRVETLEQALEVMRQQASTKKRLIPRVAAS